MTYTKPVIEATTRLSAYLFNLMETQFDEMKEIYDESDHNSLYYTKTEMNLRFAKTTAGLVSNLDADKIDGYHIDELLADGLPIGSILWWYGDSSNVPSGWNICDGSNGTPDFRDKFIVGKGSTYDAIYNTYGNLTITPTGSLTIATHSITNGEFPKHNHKYDDGWATSGTTYTLWDLIYINRISANTTRTTGSTGSSSPHGHTGSTITMDEISILPSYMALYLIKRMS